MDVGGTTPGMGKAGQRMVQLPRAGERLRNNDLPPLPSLGESLFGTPGNAAASDYHRETVLLTAG